MTNLTGRNNNDFVLPRWGYCRWGGCCPPVKTGGYRHFAPIGARRYTRRLPQMMDTPVNRQGEGEIALKNLH